MRFARHCCGKLASMCCLSMRILGKGSPSVKREGVDRAFIYGNVKCLTTWFSPLLFYPSNNSVREWLVQGQPLRFHGKERIWAWIFWVLIQHLTTELFCFFDNFNLISKYADSMDCESFCFMNTVPYVYCKKNVLQTKHLFIFLPLRWQILRHIS